MTCSYPYPHSWQGQILENHFLWFHCFRQWEKQIVRHGAQPGKIITVHFAYRRVVQWEIHCCIECMGCSGSVCMNVMAEIFKQETEVCRYPKVNGETGNSSWSSEVDTGLGIHQKPSVTLQQLAFVNKVCVAHSRWSF